MFICLTMPINANWQAPVLLKLIRTVEVSRPQRHFANFANRVIGGRWAARDHSD